MSWFCTMVVGVCLFCEKNVLTVDVDEEMKGGQEMKNCHRPAGR